VTDICASVFSDPRNADDPLFFVLKKDRELLRHYYRHVLSPKVTVTKDRISLADLLSAGRLKVPSRLSLAVSLASSVLQLHNTPWLPESWSEGVISFPVGDAPDEVPYVTAKLRNDAYFNLDTVSLSTYVLQLGIVLLELSEEISFSEWFRARSNSLLVPDDIKERARLAWMLLTQDPKIRLGKEYAKVVKRCLECIQMGEETSPIEPLYCDVVQRLETIYEVVTNPIRLEGVIC
jgi:hypothetical protein